MDPIPEWRQVAVLPYSVSSLGHVRVDIDRHPRKAGELLSMRTHPLGGGLVVSLTVDGRQKSYLVHRLIAAAFLPSQPGYVVRHLNGDKTDNRLINLELSPRSAARSDRGDLPPDLPGEQWLPIGAPFEVYHVSNLGRVRRSMASTTTRPRIMRDHPNGSGYRQVVLKNGEARRAVLIHRLVAEVFIPNPDDRPQVNHKDGNKTNNHLDNLEWMTAGMNARHAQYTLGVVGQLTVEDVLDILDRYKRGERQQDIATVYAVSQNQVSMVVLGKSWRHIGQEVRDSIKRARYAVVPEPGPEIWAPAPNCAGVDVSNHGGLRRAVSKTPVSTCLVYGYPVRTLTDMDGHRRNFKIHRLVAEAFLGPPQEGWMVNHINGVRTDNRITNLEWVDAVGNQRHRHGHVTLPLIS